MIPFSGGLGPPGPPSRGVSPLIERFFSASPKKKVCTMECESCRQMARQQRVEESQLNLALSAPCSRKSSSAGTAGHGKQIKKYLSLTLDGW